MVCLILIIVWLSVGHLIHTHPHVLICGYFSALTFEDLGLAPHKVKGYPVEFLIQYRKGGPNYGSTVSEKMSPESYPWGSVV